MNQILSSVEFWKVAGPLLGAVLAWLLNEWQKRIAFQYERKEANYKELIRSLRGFYAGEKNAESLKLDFLNQLNAAWLYCPDDVIRKGYTFIESVRGVTPDEIAMGDFVAALRSDLLSRKLVRSTELAARDFKHLTVSS